MNLQKIAPTLEAKHVGALFEFPHVVKNVDLYWGFAECVPYLESLLVDTRGGRRGFPFNTVLAIQKLVDLHNEKWPQHKPDRVDEKFKFQGL